MNNETTTVRMTEDELELALLALEYFQRHHLHEYDTESRAEIGREITTLTRKLRDA